jgi:Asp-tRNA(Asn)/Glu-tRNA(Gln) amidotransferase A subunit family amidase
MEGLVSSLPPLHRERFFDLGFTIVPEVFAPPEIGSMRAAFDRLEETARALGTTQMHRGARFVLESAPAGAVRIHRIVWCGAVEPVLDAFGRGIDVLLTPTTPTPAFRLGEKADDPLAMYLSDVYTATSNLTGIPALSVPIGRTRSGLPIAAQLLGPDFGEALLFRTATVIERSCDRLRPPILTPGP